MGLSSPINLRLIGTKLAILAPAWHLREFKELITVSQTHPKFGQCCLRKNAVTKRLSRSFHQTDCLLNMVFSIGRKVALYEKVVKYCKRVKRRSVIILNPSFHVILVCQVFCLRLFASRICAP